MKTLEKLPNIKEKNYKKKSWFEKDENLSKKDKLINDFLITH